MPPPPDLPCSGTPGSASCPRRQALAPPCACQSVQDAPNHPLKTPPEKLPPSLKWHSRICPLPSRSGAGTTTCLSKCPGRTKPPPFIPPPPRRTLKWHSRICLLPSTSGAGTTTCLSKRPGRTRALSRISGKLVAATTMTPSLGCRAQHDTAGEGASRSVKGSDSWV
jgi:hypothetical protein